MKVSSMGLYSIIVFLAVVSACTPPQKQIAWSVDLGELSDDESGYYSYFTGAPELDVADVCLVLASKPQIQGRTILQTDRQIVLYPTVPYPQRKRFVEPETLVSLVSGCEASNGHNPESLRIGYFEKTLTGRGLFTKHQDGDDKQQSVLWGELTEKGLREVASVLSSMRAVAASEGANEISSITVDLLHYSGFGHVQVSGDALVYGTIEEENERRKTVQLDID